jgi:hypothetical protein
VAGETIGVAHIMSGVVDGGRIGKASTEHQKTAQQKCGKTKDQTIREGKNFPSRNNIRSHINLRERQLYEIRRTRRAYRPVEWQVSWLTAHKMLLHFATLSTFPAFGQWLAL